MRGLRAFRKPHIWYCLVAALNFKEYCLFAPLARVFALSNFYRFYPYNFRGTLCRSTRIQFPLNGQLYPSSLFQGPGMCRSRLPFLFLVQASHHGQHSLCHHWQGLLDRLRNCYLGLCLCLSCCNCLQRKQLVNYVAVPGFSFH